jgi:hypothetical protein
MPRTGQFTGSLHSAAPGCVESANVKIVRRRGGTRSVIGVDSNLEDGRFRIEAPTGPGRYFATVGRQLFPRVGICGSARSKAMTINR